MPQAVGSWAEELFFVWSFLGPQQSGVESWHKVAHLTDMCTLPFLKIVFEVLLAKNKLQLVAGREVGRAGLGTLTQRPAFTGSTPVGLDSCIGVSAEFQRLA